MFKLKYVCSNCGNSIVCRTVDGEPAPPPDNCLNCVTVQPNQKKNQPGDVYLGLKLITYDKATRKWLVECLFCLSTSVVSTSNLGRQKSCGCLRGKPLSIGDFTEPSELGGVYTPREVFLTCSTCSFGKPYSLETGRTITCEGCG